jgi:hypothetical protein
MRGSLYKFEIPTTRTNTIRIHQENLNKRKSLSKGGSVYATHALQKIREKRQNKARDTLKKAEKALQVEGNKLKKEFNDQGVQQRKDELARKKQIDQLYTQGLAIPPNLLHPIRDCRKQPTSLEQETLRPNQSLYDAVASAQLELQIVLNTPLREFSITEVPQEVLDQEERLIQYRGGLQDQLLLDLDKGESDDVRSVATIESGLDLNADFVYL